jgi:hypothetical protein
MNRKTVTVAKKNNPRAMQITTNIELAVHSQLMYPVC